MVGLNFKDFKELHLLLTDWWFGMCQRSLNFSRHWCSCSRGLRALIVLDDVWIAQHLEPFAPLRGGKYGVTGKNYEKLIAIIFSQFVCF